ncbi:hypothetical protein ACFFRR_001172 [Megaselia abdita]
MKWMCHFRISLKNATERRLGRRNRSCQNAIEEFTQEEYLEDEIYLPLQNSVNECTLKDNLQDSHLETKNEELTRLEEAFINLSEHNSGYITIVRFPTSGTWKLQKVMMRV